MGAGGVEGEFEKKNLKQNKIKIWEAINKGMNFIFMNEFFSRINKPFFVTCPMSFSFFPP